MRPMRPTRAVPLALALLLPAAPAQTITQIIDHTGDGTNALAVPCGPALDAHGNAFVVGAGNANVFRVTPQGEVSLLIDATGNGTHPLLTASGIAVDAAGNVYVSGTDSHNVFKIEPDATITQIIDASGDGLSPLTSPSGLAVDGSGNVYVVGSGSDNAFKIGPGGGITRLIDASGDGQHGLSVPVGIDVDLAGNVYVAAVGGDNVFRIAPNGVIVELIGPSGDGLHPLIAPTGVAVDALGNAFVPGLASHNVFRVSVGGTITQLIDGSGDGSHPLTLAQGIGVDEIGNVFVSGWASHNAFRISPDGLITQVIDGTGDGIHPLVSARSLGLDGSGNLFVAGQGSDNVFKVALATDAAVGDYKPGSMGVFPVQRSGGYFTLISVTNTNLEPQTPVSNGGATDVHYQYVNATPNEANPFRPLACAITDVTEFLTPADTLTVLTACHNPSEGGRQGYLVVTARDPDQFGVDWSFNHLIGSEIVVTPTAGVYALEMISVPSPVTEGLPTHAPGAPLLLDGISYAAAPDTLMLDSFLAALRGNLTLINFTGELDSRNTVHIHAWNDNEYELSTNKEFSCWFDQPLESISPLFSHWFLALNTPNDPSELDLNCNGNGKFETGWLLIDSLAVKTPFGEPVANDGVLLGAFSAGPATVFTNGRLLWNSAATQANGAFPAH